MKKNKPEDDCYWFCLEQYHTNREAKLTEVQDIHGVSRGAAKQLFICLINNSTSRKSTAERGAFVSKIKLSNNFICKICNIGNNTS